jgi:CheY-like chemotaxis protein/ABC-type amino acid transport substrate-binding protein/HPt (histidine-containing phosphotransfer) domain-containing protein
MRLRRITKFINTLFVFALAAAAVSGCGQAVGGPASGGRPAALSPLNSPFETFRDVPGLTGEEIAAIESLKKEHDTFIYAMTLSTEAFPEENGAVGGYAALFCEWLTGLFGIRFQPEIYAWGDLVEKLDAGVIEFAGNITPTEERLKIYHMTDPVAERQYKTIRLSGSHDLDLIALNRPLRYVFIEGAAIAANVAAVTASGSYEAVFVGNYEEAYRTLESGAADAFIGDNAVVSSFDDYGDVYTNDFLPFIFSPVSMATARDELEPVISVIRKAQRNGAMPYLNYLYNQGSREYRKNKFFTHLTKEEREYLENPSPVPLAARHFNYPVDFYNTYEDRWEGLAFDVLHEVEKLTGLNFVVVNDKKTNLSRLLRMVREGEAHIIPELLISNERREYYIWTENKFITDQYALISKSHFPNVSANEIFHVRVGLIRNTVRAGLFRTWFPNAENVTEYDTDEEAMFAVEHGKVDMVMSSRNRMISYLNYYGLLDYKANYLFDYPYEATFGFNKNQTVLCSIVDKAIGLTDTYVITEQWMTRTYNYKIKLLEGRFPWLIGAIVLSLVVLALILVLFHRSRMERKRLIKYQAELESANRAKSSFLAAMSHEMRTPMNAILGLTEILLQNKELPPDTKDSLRMIYNSGYSLMGVLNELLDLSKIEAGSVRLGSGLTEDIMNFHLTNTLKKKQEQIVREPMPYGRVLVVDDMETNLYVARGLLLLYGLTIDTALSGKEAVEKIVCGNEYDIVFMDHMMPEMDGVEAVKIMRRKGYTRPIVALTANAVSGQAEMFMANGFDGFISKPVDIHELNASLNKFIRDRHPPEVVNAARAAAYDGGIAAVSESPQADSELLMFFISDAEKAIAVLEPYELRNSYGDDDLHMYIVNIHSLKGALANIGETKLSGFARELEQAGREKNIAFISDKTSLFMDELRALVNKLKPDARDTDDISEDVSEEDMAHLRKMLLVVKEACPGCDKKAAKAALAELKQKSWPLMYSELFDTIAVHLLHSDFDEVEAVCTDYLTKETG